MKREIQVFLTAVMFFTKIPCPKWVDHSPEFLNESARYFSLMGIIVGSVGAGVFWGFNLIFPQPIAILLSMLATIWLTGAFHEDGLADMFDGFGGGWTKEKILSIMKDSRIGTFGVAGLAGILALKFVSLNELPSAAIPFLLIAGHAVSRFLATTLIMTHDYVRGEPSKAKPVAKKMSPFSITVSAVFGLLPLLLVPHYWIWLSLIPMVAVLVYLGYFFNKWIGGHTGDCSGATQQLTEVTFYLSAVVIWTFI
ncbi:adenosylcobinamide-GDP ribazoletransferase [Fodinibius halophilus]|uniref:Adenosylcobinamide-GDP ribazoletransferase n=1 Tax=Fodinibius halophilus TaxID=1736908 RepID=A0A6M1SYW4_9BACT|nr:adenosylcobinamide-GDP ribazoletransferase [Fodinibius halophilus]NGP86847.1 adenosylcobinamide-GDP ribazoletransferase [Fodinibius halophilus]